MSNDAESRWPWGDREDPLADHQDRIRWERGDFSESPMMALVRSLVAGMARIENKLEEIRKEMEKGNK